MLGLATHNSRFEVYRLPPAGSTADTYPWGGHMQHDNFQVNAVLMLQVPRQDLSRRAKERKEQLRLNASFLHMVNVTCRQTEYGICILFVLGALVSSWALLTVACKVPAEKRHAGLRMLG